MTFLQIFLSGLCFRAGWFAFNWIWSEFKYLIDSRYWKSVDVATRRGYWEKL